MTEKRRSVFVVALLAIDAAIVGVAILILPARPGLNKANFDRIEIGMTASFSIF